MQGVAVPPPDEAAHQDSLLIAELAEVNTMIARYIVPLLDADAGRADQISIEDERDLADRAASAIGSLRNRTQRRVRVLGR
jgi:hypothetical protein